MGRTVVSAGGWGSSCEVMEEEEEDDDEDEEEERDTAEVEMGIGGICRRRGVVSLARSSGCECEPDAPTPAPEIGSPGSGLDPEVMVARSWE